jgi:hypothetical protein
MAVLFVYGFGTGVLPKMSESFFKSLQEQVYLGVHIKMIGFLSIATSKDRGSSSTKMHYSPL